MISHVQWKYNYIIVQSNRYNYTLIRQLENTVLTCTVNKTVMQVTKEFFNIVVRMLIYKRLIVIISYAQNNNEFYF